MEGPPLRYLSAEDVLACLPLAAERVELAATALAALARNDAEMPAKIGVHPRPGALLHAMPAWLRSADLVGMKWVAAFPDNKRHGLPAISGLIVLNDPATGLPTWVLDAGAITAHRTAAVSGVAMRLFAPPLVERVCIVGAGVQARSHLDLIGELLPGAEVVVYDKHRERAVELADEIGPRGGRAVEVADDARDAVAGADVVVTAATLQKGGAFIEPDWLAAGALVVAVDFGSCVTAQVALAARHFVTDDRGQYLAYRDGGYFDGYPAAVETLGEVIETRGLTSEREVGEVDGRPVLVSHLGVGLADVVFADAIARRAHGSGLGVELRR
jgi:alanine dehydrogenase